MNDQNRTEFPHRRYNPLTGEWVLVSPHRTLRPWQGKQEPVGTANLPSYDPSCYLCPGNERAGGVKNPQYSGTYVFTNDFAALVPDTPDSEDSDGMFRRQDVRGTCRVVCFSPHHDRTLPEMSVDEIIQVVHTWIDQYRELGREYRWVQIFENKGEIMGCSNPHPHGQIWASDVLPNEAVKEDEHQRKYFSKHDSRLLADYREQEMLKNERIVAANDHWLVVVPFWAVWPYETMVLPKNDVSDIADIDQARITSLAEILKKLLIRYDNLFEVPFPYTMGWHNAPCGEESFDHWTLHAHFYPPLLRSATVKKYMVGYEMLSEAQRDITPERAAEILRGLPEVHYKSKIQVPK
jgi:UDPglucose--hexose-1-phosphate uridylyltransferase